MDGEKAIVSLGAGLLLGGLFVGLLVNSGWRPAMSGGPDRRLVTTLYGCT